MPAHIRCPSPGERGSGGVSSRLLSTVASVSEFLCLSPGCLRLLQRLQVLGGELQFRGGEQLRNLAYASGAGDGRGHARRLHQPSQAT
jgi:hypothetical protein